MNTPAEPHGGAHSKRREARLVVAEVN